MFAGGPVSRKGFPGGRPCKLIRSFQRLEIVIREATRATPDSWQSSESSTAMMDAQREGMNI